MCEHCDNNGIIFQVLVREIEVMKDLITIESGGRERADPTIGIGTQGMMTMDNNAIPYNVSCCIIVVYFLFNLLNKVFVISKLILQKFEPQNTHNLITFI